MSGADYKLYAYAIVRPNLLSVPEHETLGHWTNGRMLCRHSAPTCFLVTLWPPLAPSDNYLICYPDVVPGNVLNCSRTTKSVILVKHFLIVSDVNTYSLIYFISI